MATQDYVITEGFPQGWCVEHRPAENASILCRQSDFAVGHFRAICVRPAATPLSKWLPIAIVLATGFDIANATPTPSEEDPHA